MVNEYHSILATLNILVCKVTTEGRFTYLNDRWVEVLGWSLDKLYSSPFFDFIHPADLYDSQLTFSQFIEKNQNVFGYRNRYLKADGGYVWLEWTSRIDEMGNIVASAIPVDEKVALEEHDHRTSVLLRQAEKMARVGHWSVDLKTQSLFWSDEIYNIHGVSKDSFQPTLESAIKFYHPDDEKAVRQYVEDALENHNEWTFNLRIIRTDGEVRHVKSQAKIYRNSIGEPQAIFGVFQDITDSVLLNQQVSLLSKVAETPASGVVICDVNRNVEWVNDAFIAMTGFSLEEIKGQNLSQFLHGEHTSKETVNDMRRILNAGGNVDTEILNYAKNGKAYWSHLIISPVMEKSSITHFVGFQQDITEKKNQEAQLLNAQKVALVGEFSAGICHELNNVLSIIGTSAESLSATCDEQIRMAQIDKITHGVRRGRRITEKLLKTVKGKNDEKTIIDVDEFIAEEVNFYRDIVPSNIEVIKRLAAARLCRLNKGALGDALLNLVINAQKAIEGTGKITIATSLSAAFNVADGFVQTLPDGAGNYIVLSISDTGVGMEKNIIDQIFTPFFSAREDGSGTGLGLSSVAAFAVNNGCGLVVESTPGKGSTFSLWLPETDLKRNGKVPQSPVKPKVLAGLHIVLVDDEKDLLEVTKMLLVADGAKVVTFENGNEALDYINACEEKIDILISDQTMRGQLQGHQLIALVREKHPHIRCTIMTGYSSHLNLDMIDVKVLQKPLSYKELRNELLAL
ncbi:PAS domain S-box protein [Aliiglaciecola sp. CAU 1673]|uniref:PAS domain S-box protein n=1 Tax=Aliiglaciecola sp. CAU 1673 TaxID=3032595 RepID=UPI0023DAAC3A|nr:PAS domain S-box protein [Aliiglaciecola sp. CAU 1673]MDF2179192.1 PAS domain S-box protein [Aliiglaciecola sp. CAU 1673]